MDEEEGSERVCALLLVNELSICAAGPDLDKPSLAHPACGARQEAERAPAHHDGHHIRQGRIVELPRGAKSRFRGQGRQVRGQIMQAELARSVILQLTYCAENDLLYFVCTFRHH